MPGPSLARRLPVGAGACAGGVVAITTAAARCLPPPHAGAWSKIQHGAPQAALGLGMGTWGLAHRGVIRDWSQEGAQSTHLYIATMDSLIILF